MKQKNIEELNSKAWYRLIKVFYVLFFVFIYVTSLGVIYQDSFLTLNDKKTKIICLLGNEKTFSADDLNIYFSLSDLKDGFDYKDYFERYFSNKYYIQNIMKACSTDPTAYYSDIFITQRVTEINHDSSLSESEKNDLLIKEYEKMKNTIFDSDKLKFLTFDTQIFDVEPSINKFKKTFFAFLSTVVVLIFFEVIRRIFYYIVIGKFIPPKK